MSNPPVLHVSQLSSYVAIQKGVKEESSMRNGSFDLSKTSALYCNLDPLLDRARLGPTLIRKQGFYGIVIERVFGKHESYPGHLYAPPKIFNDTPL